MKEWLLKDEKAKVGRPKLALDETLRKAKIFVSFGFISAFMLSFFLFCQLKGQSPLQTIYSVSFEKVLGVIENKNGFTVKEYYNKNDDYVMEINIPETVRNYSGNYKYTLYKLKNNEWKEIESKDYNNDASSFKIIIPALKNNNTTWKIKLQIINATKISKSYAPSKWQFNDATSCKDMYAYKVFTVKGYYSPVPKEELKLLKTSSDKISINTNKNNPRCFILTFPDEDLYDVEVRYTDISSKEVLFKNDKGINGKQTYCIPDMKRSSKVTFKVFGNDINDKKLSNWKSNNDYITNIYILKPSSAY